MGRTSTLEGLTRSGLCPCCRSAEVEDEAQRGVVGAGVKLEMGRSLRKCPMGGKGQPAGSHTS